MNKILFKIIIAGLGIGGLLAFFWIRTLGTHIVTIEYKKSCDEHEPFIALEVDIAQMPAAFNDLPELALSPDVELSRPAVVEEDPQRKSLQFLPESRDVKCDSEGICDTWSYSGTRIKALKGGPHYEQLKKALSGAELVTGLEVDYLSRSSRGVVDGIITEVEDSVGACFYYRLKGVKDVRQTEYLRRKFEGTFKK